MYSPPLQTGKFDQSLRRLRIFPTTNVIRSEIIAAENRALKNVLGCLAQTWLKVVLYQLVMVQPKMPLWTIKRCRPVLGKIHVSETKCRPIKSLYCSAT
jgi:hypothetical protein